MASTTADSDASLRLRLRLPSGGTASVTLSAGLKWSEAKQAIAAQAQCEPDHLEILTGYPPKVLVSADDGRLDAVLHDMDSVTVRLSMDERQSPAGASSSKSSSREKAGKSKNGSAAQKASARGAGRSAVQTPRSPADRV
eukprot:3362479-Pleurochrysis_carterae.AAC.2